MVEAQLDAAAIDGLAARASGGDAAAFAALYDHFAPRLRRFLAHQTGDLDRVEDQVQQVFVKMIEALPRYRATGAPFGAWVFRVARNLVIDERRTHHPTAPIEIAEDRAGTGDDPLALAIRSDERERLLTAIEDLPSDQHDVLVWRFLAELSPGETASVMERSPEAVRALQHRALLALRRRLGTTLEVREAAG
ncbi:MAG: sigma-70 family RNA polymerase sigma factor [Chloroflexota bacterium]